jgi:hypothetical protein
MPKLCAEEGVRVFEHASQIRLAGLLIRVQNSQDHVDPSGGGV